MNFRIVLTLVFALVAFPAAADKTGSHDIWHRDKLLGDVGGARSAMGAHGVAVDVRLSQYYQGVTSGGVNENAEYGGTLDHRVNADLTKLFGLWNGLSLSVHARTRFGEDINADVGSFPLQNAGMLMQIPGDYHGTDVTGLTATQAFTFFGGPAAASVGKFDVIDTVTGFFPHIDAGQQGFWGVHNQVSALPWFGAVRGLSLYGVIGVTINPEYKMAQSGLMALGTANESDNWGSLSDAFDEGVFMAAFHRFFWKMDDKPGYFMIFVGGSTAKQASNDPHDFVAIPGVINRTPTTTTIGPTIVDTKEERPWDVALYVYQKFWQAEGDPTRYATFFTGATVGPDNPQFAQFSYFANVEFFGLFASRPLDRMGVAGNWSGLSDNFEDLVSPVADLRNPWGFELYYNAAITPAVRIGPDIQFINNERDGDDLAIVPGVRLVIDF